MALKKQNNDPLNFRQIILDSPSQFQIGANSAKDIKLEKNFDSLIICGMGGSALPGDVLKMWFKFSKTNFPLYIHRDYNLPYCAKKQSLIICISYSGNTEETISGFKEAVKKGLNAAVISSGGKLEKLCKKIKVPLAKVPSGLPPRMALGFQFGALMQLLTPPRIVKDGLKDLLKLEKKLRPKELENKGRKIAKKLVNKIPLIYSSEKLSLLARIWKIKFNENAKTPAFYNYFPELNHNEMVGFSRISDLQPPIANFYVLILRDLVNNSKILKRMDLTAKILKKKKVPIENIYLGEKNFFAKIFSNLLLADWISYYLALESKIDPWPVEIVEEFKSALTKKC